MRLPELHEVQSEAARALYAHDQIELHCSDERNFYSQMHKSRVDTVLQCVPTEQGGRRLLDLGCAQGNTALLLAETGWEAWAVDLRPEFLVYAGLKHERGVFVRVAANATELPFPDSCFDLVVWGEMIEHVAYPEQILKQIQRVVRPNGHLLLTTPNGQRLRTGLPTFSKVKDREALQNHQFKPDSDGHLFLFSRDELEQLLRSAGFGLRQHRYYATPWISGRLGSRHFISWVPPRWRREMDGLTKRLPLFARRVAEGQVLLAQRIR